MVLTFSQVAGILILVLAPACVCVIFFVKRKNKKEKRRLETKRRYERAIWISASMYARDFMLAKLREKATEYEDVPGGQIEWLAIQEEIKELLHKKNELEAELRELEMLFG